ncbi:hypothetical protein [Streptococcus suis]|uniref:Uncharacterized protein n=2 Tax=Streptococcus suis TaxID=1307 RepID=A0AB33U0I8_STRSU|nr:hypothetical protein [Streptococcus suis]NQH86651.1 hypothetical protein [Streptococcus suis]NQN17084.1 hypothetical protein [Streptococcus suis]CYU35032.1 Uncharacterised protein [Streptococcus suis]CYX51695.1 Uncharacterised protein [Streptococcus suis]HEL1950306.1 hypothetical protein [Streptococcus suis]
MNSIIKSNTHSDLSKSFSNGVLEILHQYATSNDVETCKDDLRGHIRPYLFDYSVNQLDTALKEIRQQLIEQQHNQLGMANAHWNEMIESLNVAFSEPEDKVSNFIDEARFDQVLHEAKKLYPNLFKKID